MGTAVAQPVVAMIAANADEADQLRPAGETLETFDMPHELRLLSAWAEPGRMIRWAEQAEARGVRVLIVATGAEPALAGLLAAACRLPVLAVPTATDEADADPGLALRVNNSAAAPVAVVGPRGAEAAAMLAVRILACNDMHWHAALDAYRLHAAPDPAGGLADPVAIGPEPVESTDGDRQPVRIRSAEELNRPLGGRVLTPSPAEPAEATPPAQPRARPPARRLGRLVVDADAPEVATIEDVVDCLLEGGVVAFPTETVYGLAADATNPAAVERLFAIKGRDPGKAISLMVDSSKLLSGIAQNVTIEARRLMEAFWPGPLTLVFQKRPGNFRHVSPGTTIGVRLPDHSIPLAILQALARPLACTSANLAGEPEARSADQVDAAVGGRIDALIDGGELPERTPSTVLDVSDEPYRILRLGAISREQIGAVVGEKLESGN